MAHSLIIGMTSSGKSTLARELLRQYLRQKKPVPSLVLDPLGDDAWTKAGAKFQTADAEKYMQVVFNSRRCALFVDEAGEAIGRYAGAMQKLATRSRHYGHNAHFIAQRAQMLDKTIRDQCEYLFVFRVSKKDAETLYDEFGYDELLQSHQLQKGEFIKCGRFQKPQRIKLF